MVIMEGLYLRTKNPVYEQMARFWTRIFAANFAMGVATGIVMEFQFGTNWAGYSRFVGDIFGAALAAEGIFAFFLESGFLSLLVFGWDKISPRMHFFSTVMVSFGSIFSAIWIVVANSWQQTPAGYHLVKHGNFVRCELTDFWAVVFNPSAMTRLSHTLSGCLILGAFFVMSVAAFYLLKNRHLEFAKRCMVIGLIAGFVGSAWAGLAGDSSARLLATTQPTKLAAFEGHYKSESGGTGLYVFGIPNERERKVNLGIQIPGMLSFLVYGNFDKPVKALDQFPVKDWPPVAIPFTCFHLMVALGGYFVVLTSFGLFMLWRKKLFETRWLLWVFVASVLGPYVANEVGWASAEVGRQPWIVYGLLRTEDAVSRAVVGEHIVISIVGFSIVYFLLGMVWVNVLHSKITHGPDETKSADEPLRADLLAIATERADPGGASMTTARPGNANLELSKEPPAGDAS